MGLSLLRYGDVAIQTMTDHRTGKMRSEEGVGFKAEP